MENKRTLVIGASENHARYSHLAVLSLYEITNKKLLHWQNELGKLQM